MRTATALATALVLASFGCTRGAAPATSTMIRELEAAQSGSAVVRRFEIAPHADGKLLVAFGDRVSELDLTPEKEDPKQADALVALGPLKKGERTELVMRARPWRGDDVLASMVEPLSPEAAKAAMAADPEFHKRKMIEVELSLGTQRATRRIVLAGGEALGASLDAKVGGVLATGVPLVLQQWVMAEPSGFVPQPRVDGTRLVAFSDAKRVDVPVAELPAPLWTLWLQLEP